MQVQKKKAAMKKFPPASYAQSEYCGRGLNQSKEFLFAKYVFVNHKYAWGKKLTCQTNPTWKL